MQPSQVFQITSIEPAQLILPLVAETANLHELAVEIAEQYFTATIRRVPRGNRSHRGTRIGWRLHWNLL